MSNVIDLGPKLLEAAVKPKKIELVEVDETPELVKKELEHPLDTDPE